MTKLQEKVSSPLYIQIKSYLYSLIASGKADDQLPSENELAHRFHVSRGTAKQAIMDLVYEGEVYRRKGKGTFIRSSSIDRNYGHRLPSFTKDISSKDSDVTTTCLFFGPVDPTGYMKQLFELADGEKVVRFKRCVSIDGEPYVVLSSYLNPHPQREVRLQPGEGQGHLLHRRHRPEDGGPAQVRQDLQCVLLQADRVPRRRQGGGIRRKLHPQRQVPPEHKHRHGFQKRPDQPLAMT